MTDTLRERAEEVILASRAAERRYAPRRQTKRRPKPLTKIVSWEDYPHEFAPIAALAARWGESAQTIRKWIRNGILRGFKLGGWKVKAVDARAFEEKSEFKVAV